MLDLRNLRFTKPILQYYCFGKVIVSAHIHNLSELFCVYTYTRDSCMHDSELTITLLNAMLFFFTINDHGYHNVIFKKN